MQDRTEAAQINTLEGLRKMHWSRVCSRSRCNTRPFQNNSIFFVCLFWQDRTKKFDPKRVCGFNRIIYCRFLGRSDRSERRTTLSDLNLSCQGSVRFSPVGHIYCSLVERQKVYLQYKRFGSLCKTAETFKLHKPAQETPANKTDTTKRLETNVLLIFSRSYLLTATQQRPELPVWWVNSGKRYCKQMRLAN